MSVQNVDSDAQQNCHQTAVDVVSSNLTENCRVEESNSKQTATPKTSVEASSTTNSQAQANTHVIDGEDDRPPQTMGEPSSNGALESLTHQMRSVNTAASEHDVSDGQGLSKITECGGGGVHASESTASASFSPTVISPSFSDDKLTEEVISPVNEARRLFVLRGVTRKEVAEILGARPSPTTTELGEAYMALFDFRQQSIVDAIRSLLERCSIVGETQAQERILGFFSARYAQCNDTLGDGDSVHSLAAAVMLLNQDLHGQNLGKKMTASQFQRNVALIREGQPPLSKALVKEAYSQIKSKPLQFITDEDDDKDSLKRKESAGIIVLPNSVVEVDLDDYPTVLRDGLLKRKNVAGGLGQRRWSLRHCLVRGFIFYMFKAEGRAAKLAHDFTNMHAAIILTHALARPAINYHKRLHAMQLTDSDGNYHLFQASGYDDLMSWVIAINRAAAIYSSRPLAAAATSSSKFERPVLPKHPSKANPEEQLAYYKEKVDEIAKALAEEEQQTPKELAASSRSKRATLHRKETRFTYLSDELVRYQSYVEAMTLRHEFTPAATKASDLLSPSHSIASMSSSAGSVSMVSVHKRAGYGPTSTFHVSSDDSSVDQHASAAASCSSMPGSGYSGTMTPPPGAAVSPTNLPGTRNSYREAMLLNQ